MKDIERKIRMRILSGTIFLCILLMSGAGCSNNKSGEAAKPGVVDYMTGAENVKAYKQAKSKLEKVNQIVEETNQEVE